jgi:hypothetical protein
MRLTGAASHFYTPLDAAPSSVNVYGRDTDQGAGIWPASTLVHQANPLGVGILPGLSQPQRAGALGSARLPFTAVEVLSEATARLMVQERLTG